MRIKKIWPKLIFAIFVIALILYSGNRYLTLAQQSNDWSPAILLCKNWETTCNPNSTDPNSGCSPIKVCDKRHSDLTYPNYQSREICESSTRKTCEFSMCDYAPPGTALKEVCGDKSRKGWYPTGIKTAKTNDLKTTCEQKEGIWLEQYKECESGSSKKGIDASECQSLGGQFNNCASMCRHDPKAETCATVCINVCKFN